MPAGLILGIDTSNYTTSLCALSAEDGTLLADVRRVLPVAEGERGLRQSDALFFHIQRLPSLMDELVRQLRGRGCTKWRWCAVGASVRPRPFGRSYMPVFTAGVSFGWSLARAAGLVFIPTSHQEGHLAAAEYFLHGPGSRVEAAREQVEAPHAFSAFGGHPALDASSSHGTRGSSDTPFLAVHLSGGTSDVLYAERTRWGYRIEMVGEGADLHAGQFVDRVGVALGLPFPAGPALERLAAEAAGDGLTFPVRVDGARMSFSGPCSAALRAIDGGAPAAEVARGVERAIANAVAKAVAYAYRQRPAPRCIVAGGVASNRYVRDRIERRLAKACPGLAVAFAPARYASDNAVGVAYIAWRGLSVLF
ncbi:O-sialoglycoprotein endopeptidase [Alicyclobacillus cellulosilyticus]|uniref:O-sialoglycoprotein endopeptidase n=1 Tax=Alicyclobacillus cellulosilyticus TaxID=1003997 RepID=A0A917K1A7_9BACL|nr:peptidase M22 [Alicyclobacillus cellulosilyticus]GGI95884.1 O-sialoglycoprotein endopeptidase [Alicyclobacillus cellulosilyticus]